MTEISLSPILIASPTKRSGTTLVQRLLCSSPDTFIFGESSANDLILLSTLLTSKQITLLSSKNFRNEQLHSVLSGKVNAWIPDLLPDIDEYLDAYKKALLAIITFYSDFALKNNRPVWGMKLPEWNPANLLQVHQIFPKCKVIFVRRNLKDCVKSAKKMDMIRGDAELHHFCQTWKQFTQFGESNLKSDWILNFSYEDLISHPEQSIDQLEKFTGSKSIDRTVLSHKINTYEQNPLIIDGLVGYLEPDELSEGEEHIVESYMIDPSSRVR